MNFYKRFGLAQVDAPRIWIALGGELLSQEPSPLHKSSNMQPTVVRSQTFPKLKLNISVEVGAVMDALNWLSPPLAN